MHARHRRDPFLKFPDDIIDYDLFQCLCEELEYSDLLEKAVQCEDPHERMVFVAAFAVSAYASTYTRWVCNLRDRFKFLKGRHRALDMISSQIEVDSVKCFWQ